MEKHKKKIYFLFLCICMVFFSSCRKEEPKKAAHQGTPRDHTPSVLIPEAPGTTVIQEGNVTLDVSNISEGYFMVLYTGSIPKVRVQVIAPDGTKNQPLLSIDGDYQAFPLTQGDGSYQINILENTVDTSYAVILSQTIDVTLSNPFKPFLYANQYVDYTSDTKAVSKASELASDTYSDLEVIQNIYHYVTENIVYDEVKAEQVKDGYLPSVDETLTQGTGICFDYASLMTSMMRTQNIPTKLEIGYSGDVKHAWISAYTKEQGWIDNIIEFNGSTWTLMDPTLASSNSKESVKKYVGDGSNYTLQYSY